jgi:hypothetical protein
MKTLIEYIIVAEPFHADAATHDQSAEKVNEKLTSGYELLGCPFLSEEMMYQPCRVRKRHCCRSLPSEPNVKVSLHSAQAASKPRDGGAGGLDGFNPASRR